MTEDGSRPAGGGPGVGRRQLRSIGASSTGPAIDDCPVGDNPRSTANYGGATPTDGRAEGGREEGRQAGMTWKREDQNAPQHSDTEIDTGRSAVHTSTLACVTTHDTV